jgi:hypothetical protein
MYRFNSICVFDNLDFMKRWIVEEYDNVPIEVDLDFQRISVNREVSKIIILYY